MWTSCLRMYCVYVQSTLLEWHDNLPSEESLDARRWSGTLVTPLPRGCIYIVRSRYSSSSLGN